MTIWKALNQSSVMKKIIFITIIITKNIFSCPHTVSIQFFLREKIDCIMVKEDVKLISREDIIKVGAYLEVLDYVSAID